MINNDIYNINLDNFIENLIPKFLRKPIFIKWMYSICYPFYLMKLWIFEYYRIGLTQNELNTFNPLTSYIKNTIVIYNQSIYVCVKDSIGLTPSLNLTHWYKVNEDRIGIIEKEMYNLERLKLEYSLNRRYNTVFRQPINGQFRPDIYIVSNVIKRLGYVNLTKSGYIVRETSNESYVYETTNVTTNLNDCTIYVPDVIFTTLDLIEFKNYVDTYIHFGIKYNIVNYAGNPINY